jgi:hypothetical protein
MAATWAFLRLGAMPNTNSCLNGLFGASLMAATLFDITHGCLLVAGTMKGMLS